jgi:aspartyl-tRNA(Asn)/glutamyl-tRNA(Gln) amidotransferase subunit A
MNDGHVSMPATIVDAVAWLSDGRVSATELVAESIARARATQDSIGAFITICEESALVAAKQADAKLDRGEQVGPLNGIPFAVKDVIATEDAITTANSRVIDPEWGNRPDATVVRRLRAAGAVLVGKLGCHEFATSWPDPETSYTVVKNPWDLSRSPGGSSTGSGAAVAAGLVLGSLGTDTGGSVRDPASHCGISGIKPTYGLVSRDGCLPLSPTLDVVGPLARSALDCALLLDVISGHDPADPTSARVEQPPMTSRCSGSFKGVRIGVPDDYFFDLPDLDPQVLRAVRHAIDEMANAGAKIESVRLPFAEEASAATIVIYRSEGFAYHERRLRTKSRLFGTYTRRGLQLGALFSAADYIQAQRLRGVIQLAWQQALEAVDVIVVPTIGSTAPVFDGYQPDANVGAPELTGAFNLVGFPAMSIPCGFDAAGLPIGMQVVAKPFDEPLVFKVGDAYQRLSDVHLRRPPLFSWA